MNKRVRELLPEFDPDQKYSQREIAELADQLLREHSRTELCRECGEDGQKTGYVKPVAQNQTDLEGNVLILDFPEYECENGHCWFLGEGAVRGIGGKDPILFEEHFQSRKRREIFCALGTPDPSIVSGMYNRAHPQGRKINSPEARAKHGASYYRAYMLPVTISLIGVCHHLLHVLK